MTADRWLEVESVAAAALEQPTDKRIAFLDETCGDDSALRTEVESLLAYEGAAEHFLSRVALEEAARMFADQSASESAECLIPGYEISELLGAGGMGEVYRARDQRLDREVAIKVFPRAAGHEQPTPRFEEEARAASALNHPNIVTIYSVGNQDDLAYIVMELVSGRRLRDLLADGTLPEARILDLAVQLADGLAAAHAAGIVHRDLKPENIMVTDEGLVKILDFGIARRRQGSSVVPAQAVRVSPGVVTGYGRIAGTIGYMAPEQAAGESVDYRADQFSLGAILDEMNPERQAAGSLAHVIERCLNPNPEDRYASTRALASDLRRIRDQSLHGRHRTEMTRRRAVMLGSAALVTTAAGISAWRWLPALTRPRRLAVLPFTNALQDADAEYLCDGIADVLIRQLGRMPALTVSAWNTVVQLKGKPNDPRKVGQQLGVDEVLMGSVNIGGGRAQVQAELVDATTGTRIWGEEFKRSDADVLAIQTDLAGAIIADGLHLKLTDAENRDLRQTLTADPAAYRLFLQAIHHFRLEKEQDYLEARGLLEMAVERDPTFALALLTLASTYSVMAVDGYDDPRVVWPHSHAYVTRALAADPMLPDAHAERATEAFFYKWDWATAQQEWDEALKSPRNVQAELLTSYALQQWALGRNDEALRSARAARSADRLSPMLAVREADVLATSGRFDAAADLYSKAIHDQPDATAAYFGLAEVHRSQGRIDDALDSFRRGFEAAGSDASHTLASLHGRAGLRELDRILAEGALASLMERVQAGKYASPLDWARAYARLGRTEMTFFHLEEAFTHRSAGLVLLKVDRAWDTVRSDPHFGAAVRRVGLA
jgi:serine/threonine-protein kinase